MMATRIDRGSTATTQIYQDGTDLVFERTFDAPRDRVWRAFFDADIVPRWWGPHGTTTKVLELDGRTGGTWRFLSSGADRDDVEFFGEFVEVVPPERFTWTFLFDVDGAGPQGGPETFTFEERDGRTTVTSRGSFGSVEAIEGAIATGMVKGALETWDRLEAELARG